MKAIAKNSQKINKIEDNAKDSFDVSYSNKILRHLDRINMDPWYFIYSNYVNPPSKEEKS